MTMTGNESFVERCLFLTFITEDIDQVRHIYIMACLLDAILILPTIVLNILLLISLYRSPQLKKPCTKLLYSLAISDVLVGMVIEPAYVAKKIAELQHSFEVYCFMGMVTYIGGFLSCVSFFNVTAIAVDRYLGVHSGTKYQTMVTNTRVTCLIIAIWASSAILFTAQLYSSRSLYFNITVAVMVTCVATASICYIRCFITLREHKRQINFLFRKSTYQVSNISHLYRTSTHTMLYIFVIFNLCYLPYLCTAVSAGILGESAAIWGAESLTVVIIYTNSLINPIILFWRMKEIRQAFSTRMSSIVHSVNHHDNQVAVNSPTSDHRKQNVELKAINQINFN